MTYKEAYEKGLSLTKLGRKRIKKGSIISFFKIVEKDSLKDEWELSIQQGKVIDSVRITHFGQSKIMYDVELENGEVVLVSRYKVIDIIK